RHQHARPAAPRRGVYRSHPERREARAAAGAASDPVRHGHQHEDREGPRLDRTAIAACARRRAARVKSCCRVGTGMAVEWPDGESDGYFAFWAPTKARPLGPTPLTWMITESCTSTKCGMLAGSV